MNGYLCFYDGKKVEVWATTSYAAQQQAARLLKVPKKKIYLVTPVLCERADGSVVAHSPAEF